VRVGDFREHDLRFKSKRKLYWRLSQERTRKQSHMIKYLRNQNFRLKKKIHTMNDMILHLKSSKLVTIDKRNQNNEFDPGLTETYG
jgi:hypothetical protein